MWFLGLLHLSLLTPVGLPLTVDLLTLDLGITHPSLSSLHVKAWLLDGSWTKNWAALLEFSLYS